MSNVMVVLTMIAYSALLTCVVWITDTHVKSEWLRAVIKVLVLVAMFWFALEVIVKRV